MFRLAFGIACVLLIWLQSLFTDTVQIDRGDAIVFQYNWVPWFFLVLMMLVLVGFIDRILAARQIPMDTRKIPLRP